MSERFVLDRDALASGELSPHLKAAEEAGIVSLLSDEEREANRRETLARHPAGRDLWVFGFGSLMWNPACHVAEMRPALVRGWHRRFCLWTLLGRGTPDLPGLTLGLEPGGACKGMALRIEADRIDEETSLIWRREMIAGAYRPIWVTLRFDDDTTDEAVTFAIDPAYERYAGHVPDDILAHHLGNAEGPLGPCIEYLEKTVEMLNEIGQTSGPMHHLLGLAQGARRRHRGEEA